MDRSIDGSVDRMGLSWLLRRGAHSASQSETLDFNLREIERCQGVSCSKKRFGSRRLFFASRWALGRWDVGVGVKVEPRRQIP